MRGRVLGTFHVAWTADDVSRAAALWRELVVEEAMSKGAADREIAAELGRTESSVTARRQLYGDTFGGPKKTYGDRASHHGPPAHVLAEREARVTAALRRTQTQEFFGDPPPGYSALDRRRS